MKTSKEEFFDLLNDIRSVLNEDNVDLSIKDIDKIIIESDNKMFDVIEKDANQRLREKKNSAIRAKRSELFRERKKNLEQIADKHISLLKESLNASEDDDTRRIADMKILETEIIEDINRALAEE